MATSKVKELINTKGRSFADYARILGIYPQTLNNKFNSGTYSVSDLIKLAELTNTTLTFIDDKGKPVITLDTNDIPTQKRPTHD